MKKFNLLVLALIVMIMSSCMRDEPKKITLEDILGSWILYGIVDAPVVETDDAFVMDIQGDRKIEFSKRSPENRWISNPLDYTYHDETLTITGESLAGEQIEVQLKLGHYANGQMPFTVVNYVVDGQPEVDTKKYIIKKANFDNKELILGTWEGYEVDADKKQIGETHRWEYLEEGKYIYYLEKNAEGNWIPKNDNNGKYNLYNDFLVSEYENNAGTGTIDYSCESWYTVIGYDQYNNGKLAMVWEAVRDKTIQYFYMAKVVGEEQE